MTNRKQSVQVLDSVASSKELNCGVRQGSVRGPLLFTMYTAPLSVIISGFSGIKHHLYADNTQIFMSASKRKMLPHPSLSSKLLKISPKLDGSQ